LEKRVSVAPVGPGRPSGDRTFPRTSPPAPRRHRSLGVLVLAVLFVAIGGLRIGALGIPSEEILPHLFHPPRVAELPGDDGRGLRLETPYDGLDSTPRPGLQVAQVWPTLSVITPARSYPLLTETWQAAYLSYPAAALAPLLGGGIEGLRRVSLLLGAAGLVLVAALARRLTRGRGPPSLGLVAAALLASSVGYLFFHRFAYLIETGPPLAATLALMLALGPAPSAAEPPGGAGAAEKVPPRLVLAGLSAGVAVALKITAVWVLAGMALYSILSRRVPRRPLRVWAAAVLAALVPLVPFAILWALGGPPEVLGRKLSLLADPVHALRRLPHVAWLAASYLGHPMALLGPVFRGERSLAASPWAGLLPAAATLFAALRVARRRDDRDPELLWLCALAAVLVPAALLYDEASPLQVAFYLLPLYALVLARALFAAQGVLARVEEAMTRRWPRRGSSRSSLAGAVVAALAVGLQAHEIGEYVAAHRGIRNPMLSMEGERELTAALVARGDRAPLTVTYNAAGVLEHLSGGALAPVHLYPLFYPRGGKDRTDPEGAERGLRAAFACARGPLVLPLGDNPFEGGREDLEVVRAAFPVAAAQAHLRPREVGRFPGGEEAAMFALYALDPVPGQAPLDCAAAAASGEGADREERGPRSQRAASWETTAALGGIAPGTVAGAFVVASVSEPAGGAIAIVAQGKEGAATFEVRLAGGDASPPGRAGAYAVYYRHAPAIRPEDLAAGAAAIAERIASAPPGLSVPKGLLPLPAAGGQPL
jgi:hypothetical protein